MHRGGWTGKAYMEDTKQGYAGAKASRKNRKLNMAFLIMRWCESESQNEGRNRRE